MRPDRIITYSRDVVALVLGAAGFVNEMLKDKPEILLLILFFGMVLAPMPFAFLAMRSQGTQPTPPTPEPPSGSAPPQPQPSSSPTS